MLIVVVVVYGYAKNDRHDVDRKIDLTGNWYAMQANKNSAFRYIYMVFFLQL